ncbi:MAG: efflux RND transporter permease subunit [Rhodothermia bacterium]|nr:MAG: efflux RND transporter permease subunit [Rhodothermia bacterium]
MKITNTAIKYHTTVVVATIILTLAGIYSYTTIPKEASPSIEVPNIGVSTIYPGASPADIESLITQHIEREVQVISGIKEIRSTSTEGISSIQIEFEPDISVDDAFSKVRDKVDLARPDLPSDVEEPVVYEFDFSEFPILTVNLSAPYPLTRLKEVAEDLQDELEAIQSVLEVDLIGGLDREVQINADLSRLQSYNLTFSDLVDMIRDENTNLPGGSVDVDQLNYLVRVDGEFDDPFEIENLIIRTENGVPIYVRDVADVDFGFKDRESFARLAVYKDEADDGTLIDFPVEDEIMLPVISLNVKKRSGDNILETVAEVDEVLKTFPFPNGTKVIITGDRSVWVTNLITDLENNIISGLIFVIAVLFFFLGIRNAILVGIAIPLSMFLSFTVFQALGYTLNFIILFSLIIALGMLVDNAVVIVENIYRYRSNGYSRFEAAKRGTAEVAGPVVASTATTVAVFVPMMFWPGMIGEFMSYMPLTLIITLLCSLFVAIIINPVLTGTFVRLESDSKVDRPALFKYIVTGVILVLGLVLGIANWRTLVVIVAAVPLVYYLHMLVLKRMAAWFMTVGLPSFIEWYRETLNWMLDRDYSVKHALLRNAFALGSLTFGVVFLLVGAVVSSTAGSTAGLILFVPGGLLTIVGVLATLFHTMETIYLGGKGSVRVGLIFGLLSLAILSLMSLGPKDVALSTIMTLMAFPIVIAVIGLAGATLNKRRHLVLTDNRASLMNTSLGALFGIIFMFAVAPTGVEFFPDTDPQQVRVTVTGQIGMNIEASNNLVSVAQKRVAALLESNTNSKENVKNLLINVGVSQDADYGSGTASPERSRITMNMVDYEDRFESSTTTLTKLREGLRGIPGAELNISKDSQGPPTGAPVNIEVSGREFLEIVRIAREIKQILRQASETGAIPGLVDVADNLDTGRPELMVRIDRLRAAQFGLSTREIASTVRAAVNGVEAGKYRDGDDEYDIVVRLRESDRSSLESLNNLTILDEGNQIPLVAVAGLQVSGGFGSITRLDMDRVVTVSGNAAPGFNGQAILAKVRGRLAEYENTLPAGYNLAYTGENEEQAESFSFLTVVLLVGVSLIFMIMVAQFNRVSSPFIIMVAVGFSLVGVILGLILTRTPFGLMTFIGVISLAGIVVNNNIVLIDYTMQLQAGGMTRHDAIIEAGATRLRPVLLTALTTILGLIPLTFGINIDFVGLLRDLDPNFQFGSENTQFWGPMGTAIISGLGFATFLTLVIVPVMYSIFDSAANQMRHVFGEASDDSFVAEATADQNSEMTKKLSIPSGVGTPVSDSESNPTESV